MKIKKAQTLKRREFTRLATETILIGSGVSLPVVSQGQLIPFRRRSLRASHQVTSESPTITVPATAKAGNYAILWDCAGGASYPTEVWPAGWTKVTESNINMGAFVGKSRSVASHKILAPGDIGTTFTGLTGTSLGSTEKLLLIFPGAYSACTPFSINHESTEGDPSAQVVTSSGGTPPFIAFGFSGGVPNGASVAFDSSSICDEVVVGALDMRVAYKSFLSAPKDTSFDYADSGTVSHLASFYVNLDYAA